MLSISSLMLDDMCAGRCGIDMFMLVNNNICPPAISSLSLVIIDRKTWDSRNNKNVLLALLSKPLPASFYHYVKGFFLELIVFYE